MNLSMQWQSLLAVSPKPPASMEDTYPQRDKGMSTDEKMIPQPDEERSEDTFGDNNFCHAYSLTNHQIPNTGDRQFSCIQCNKDFSQSSPLKKHKLVHTGEKKFACDQCDKASSSSGNLKTHKLSHTGENKGRNGTNHGQFRSSWEVMRKSIEIHEKVMRKSWESQEKVMKRSWESHTKVKR